MKILVVSQGDASAGGGSRIAEQLTTGLDRRGHDVGHVVRVRPRDDNRERTDW